MNGHQPRIFIQREWTPGLVSLAVAAAATGYYQLLGELIEVILYGDDRVRSCFDTRADAVRLPAYVEHEDPAVRDAYGEDFGRMLPLDTQAEIRRWRVGAGWCLVRASWSFRPFGRVLAEVSPWHPSFTRQVKPGQWQALMDFPGGRREWVPCDLSSGEWFLFGPEGISDPWRFGLWRALVSPWDGKAEADGSWTNYNRWHGQPRLWGHQPDGSPEDVENLLEDLLALDARSALSTKGDTKIGQIEAQGTGWQTYLSRMDNSDKRSAILILGQNLTTEISGSTQTGSGIHDRVKQDRLDRDSTTEADLYRRTFGAFWYLYNFGGAAERAPRRTWRTSRPATVEEQRKALELIHYAREKGTPIQNEEELLGSVGLTLKALEAPPLPSSPPAVAETSVELPADAPAGPRVWTPPAAVRQAAAAGLLVPGASRRALDRARRLANGSPLQEREMRALHAWHLTYKGPSAGEGSGDFQCYGGEPGRIWLEEKIAELDAEELDAPAEM